LTSTWRGSRPSGPASTSSSSALSATRPGRRCPSARSGCAEIAGRARILHGRQADSQLPADGLELVAGTTLDQGDLPHPSEPNRPLYRRVDIDPKAPERQDEDAMQAPWLRYTSAMDLLQRITRDPAVMGGRACIRGMRVTVGTILGLLAAGRTHEEVLQAYPYLEPEDIRAALSYAAWRAEEVELPLT